MEANCKCPDCPASFWDAADLERHRKDAHDKTPGWASAKGVAAAAVEVPKCPHGVTLGLGVCYTCEAEKMDVERFLRDPVAYARREAEKQAAQDAVPEAVFPCPACDAEFLSEADGHRHYYDVHFPGATVGGTKHQTLVGKVTEQMRNAAAQMTPKDTLPDHVSASVQALYRIVDRLRAGTPPEDLGKDVELLGRIMARRT